MGQHTAHWKVFERIPPQGGLYADREETSDRTGRSMGLSPDRVNDGGGNIAVGGDLSLLPPEHSHTV